MKRNKTLISSLSLCVAFLFFAFAPVKVYACDYHASENAVNLSKTDGENYRIERIEKNIVFCPEKPIAGFIFYPGAKVEYTAYAPLMAEFANRGVLCVIVKMPLNLAIFKMNAADSVRKMISSEISSDKIKNWYIGGHSLGGAMAASYIAKHTDEYDGLILFAAYSVEDLSDTKLKVASLYGSEDKVLNPRKYTKNRKNLPPDFSELVIEGGCHAYFGDYGFQRGDGAPSISREEQIEITVDFLFGGGSKNFSFQRLP